MIKVKNITIHNGVPVVEGDIVFLNVNDNDGLFSKLFKGFDDVRPIIISNTEEIEIGDKYIDEEFMIKTFEEKDKLKKEIRVKVIAFPENFSEQHYQDIKSKKIKDGDVVLIECEERPDTDSIGNGNTLKEAMKNGRPYQIKLDAWKHITIYPSDIEPSGWIEVSSELKKFCDEKGYTDKPLMTVMPMIIQFLDDKYLIKKR